MRLTCQGYVKRHKYSSSVVKAWRFGILNLLISIVYKFFLCPVICSRYSVSRQVYKKTEGTLYFTKDDPGNLNLSKTDSVFGFPGRMETFRFLEARKGKMKSINCKQTTSNRMKYFLIKSKL